MSAFYLLLAEGSETGCHPARTGNDRFLCRTRARPHSAEVKGSARTVHSRRRIGDVVIVIDYLLL